MTNGLLIYGEIFAHIFGSPSSYMTLQLLHSELPYIWGKFDFLFLSVHFLPFTFPSTAFHRHIHSLDYYISPMVHFLTSSILSLYDHLLYCCPSFHFPNILSISHFSYVIYVFFLSVIFRFNPFFSVVAFSSLAFSSASVHSLNE